MKRCLDIVLIVVCLAVTAEFGWSKSAQKDKEVEASEVDPYMGIYEGEYEREGERVKAEAKVVPRGGGKYLIVLTAPPSIESDESRRLELQSAASKQKGLKITGQAMDTGWQGALTRKDLVVRSEKSGKGKFSLKRVDRKSPTLGRKPPQGAVVLLPTEKDGSPSLEEWKNESWKPVPDGSMQVGKGNNLTVREFGDSVMHLEFMCPYQPHKRGQGRGNSGVYVQNRYELQILDSFGLKPADNRCGGIYKISTPDVNASLPPLEWQTYDVVFRAPRFSEDGTLEKNAVFEEVKLNGVVIHENVELPHPTVAAGGKGHRKKAPLMLQDHGQPVRYRNIWVKPEGNRNP